MAAINEVSVSESDAEHQYLTFIMAGEEYGVDILAVQEIRGWEDSTLSRMRLLISKVSLIFGGRLFPLWICVHVLV